MVNDYSFGWNLKSERCILVAANGCEWIPTKRMAPLSCSSIYTLMNEFSWRESFCHEKSQSFLHIKLSITVRNGCIEWSRYMPLWTCFQVTKTKILAKCVENRKKKRTFPFGISTPIRIFEIKDFHIRAASTKAHFGLNYYLMSFSPNRTNQFFFIFC